MPRSRGEPFTTIRSEGALLPPDFLRQIAEGRDKIPGLTPEAYHLPGTERLNEAASRSWNRLLGAWGAFQTASQSLAETDPGTGITREKWLLPLFQELGYGRLLTAKTFEIEGKPYPISHAWQHTPIHLVGRNVDLDRRSPGVAGAAKASPHGLVQEFLNRSTDHLWGLLSNGIKLRILRESKSLTRQAYIEFDLAGMMEGQVYADFAILWLLCHQSRVEAERPAECWLEKWSETARAQGTRALEDLRSGVEKAIEALGCGFLAFPSNIALREQLQGGTLGKQDYFRQLLRIAYRVIFLFIAEDRDLLLTPESREVGSREVGLGTRDSLPTGQSLSPYSLYMRYYSADRLRTLAERRRGSPHPDLWLGLRLVFAKLGADTGCPALGLPALGSFLWSERATPDLNDCQVANRELLQAIRALAFTQRNNVRRPIDYKNIGTEELGSVYQSLLEQHPDVHVPIAKFTLGTHAGHERKTTGSFYTPSPLVQSLLDTALEPVLRERIENFTTLGYKSTEEAILDMKVADISCGSGHFLIAAAHRMAKRLAAIRTGEEEPAPEAIRHALRDVIGRCIYGVDINPMAVELCKFALWLEALEPGKPLSFLDHHIRVGNSLLGTTPELIAAGLPDDAFSAIEGDDKKVCSALKKRNKQEREGQRDMVHLMVAEPRVEYNSIEARTRGIDEAPDNTIEEVQCKTEQFRRLVVSPEYQHARDIADAWCAAFVWKKQTNAAFEAITTDTIRRLEADPNALTPAQHREVERLSSQYQFFHWHLAFPEVFAEGGFDCVLGNPPWERVKVQEQEFFATRSEAIAKAANAAARKRLIVALPTTDPMLWGDWCAASRETEGQSQFVRHSGRYPLSGKGDVNTYALFAEHNRAVLGPTGRAGFIVPTGIATDDTTKEYFDALVSTRQLARLYDFENTAKAGFFRDVGHGNIKFSLITVSRVETAQPEFVFYAHHVSELEAANRRFQLTAADIAALNPNTRTCPTFRSRQDADINLALYRRAGILWREDDPDGNPWGLRFMRMMDMANDSGLFRLRAQLQADGWERQGNRFVKQGNVMLPLVEAKMVHHFDHRFGDYRDRPDGVGGVVLPGIPPERKDNPHYQPEPQYWVPEEDAVARLDEKWSREWLIGWRDITRAVDQRTVFASLIPRAAVGHKFLLMMPSVEPRLTAALYGNLCSFALDYTARQKVGGSSLTYFTMRQLPVIAPAVYGRAALWTPASRVVDWLLPRVLELTYTAWDLEPFAQDCGWSGPPFRWDEERRFLLRCELDAAFFHLYLPTEANGDPASSGGSRGASWRQAEGETAEDLARLKASFPAPRDAVAYIMDTFPIVRRRDEKKYDGDYRTKRVILEIYDAMQEAIRTGHPYQTRLDPPPADPGCCHPPKKDGAGMTVSSR